VKIINFKSPNQNQEEIVGEVMVVVVEVGDLQGHQ
jgi:hypothetical protein